MTEIEVSNLLSRIRIYYQNMSKSDEVDEEWYRVLKKYNASDVTDNLNGYLQIEKNRSRIPMPQDLVVGLFTLEQKEKLKNDFIIDCNLCGRMMTLTEYNTTHHKKCLLIKALLPIAKGKNNQITYEDLEKYSYNQLDKLYERYGEFKNKKFYRETEVIDEIEI